MQILTDTGADLSISAEEQADLKIRVIPQMITLDGKTYRSGVDIDPEQLYQLFEQSPNYPTTSLPSAGDFARIYRQMAEQDPEILSIHLSAGLSGTYNAAVAGAQLAPEARVIPLDCRSVSIAQGWMVVAAARAVRAGWALDRVIKLIEQIGSSTESLFTMSNLGYVIHGGRVGHIRGLVASALQIKPLMGIDKAAGQLTQLGLARTVSGAVEGLARLIAKQIPVGTAIRAQIGNTKNFESAGKLKEAVSKLFPVNWMPDIRISAALGAHAGPTLVGVVYAPQAAFNDLP